MKKLLFIFFILWIPGISFSQTNTFPSSGNAGIGTTSPVSALHIKKNQAAATSLVIENDGSTSYTAANVVLKSNVDLAYRGMGIYLYDAPSEKEWYIGSSYANNDRFIIARKTSVSSSGMSTAMVSNSLFTISNAGNVGIGIFSPSEKLSVNGNIRAKEIKVETSGWPDYVFEPDYKLPDLAETEQYIKANRHLPGVPSAKEAEEHGINLGEMNSKLLKKIEELTLYLIEKDKQVADLQERMKKVEGRKSGNRK